MACFLPLASGCFYLGPMPFLEENLAPEPFAYPVDPGTPVAIGEAGRTVFVIAEDPEADPIAFTWVLSNDGYVGTATPIPYGDQADGGAGSQVVLPWDPDLDGQILSCFIDDGENEAVVLYWPLEVYL